MSRTRAVILAAGQGQRLMPLTADRPKCMVELEGIPLLERQLRVFRRLGVSDVSVVAGHAATALQGADVRMVLNPAYARSNMVTSLFCAESLMTPDADLIVSYGDIVFQANVLEALLASAHPISVCSDRRWRAYWELRMSNPLADAETFKLDARGCIVELGKKPRGYEDIQGQYIGLIKFRADQLVAVRKTYHALDRSQLYDGKDLANMFMTSFLQALIERDFELRPVLIDNGWLEVDTLADLDAYRRMAAAGDLRRFYDDAR